MSDLLKWAIEFVERETRCLEECHSGPGGVIDDDEVSDELRDARRWLSEAREYLTTSPGAP